MKKGILIYAIGHSNYYRMAEVLAASLVASGVKEKEISVGLICDDKSKLLYPHLFDDFVLLKPEKFMEDGKIVFNNATILVHDLSPYDITIKLDGDMVWITERDPLKLFDQLKDIDITFETTGHGWDKGNSVWIDEESLKEAYKLTGKEKLYKIFGEFLYFKKTPDTKKFFKAAKEAYFKKKVKTMTFSNGSFTDELAFQVACMQTGIYPHQDVFTPTFNKYLGLERLNRKYPYELTDFYAYSIGGNQSSTFIKMNYNTLAKHYFAKLGLFNPYQVEDKRSFLPERKLQ